MHSKINKWTLEILSCPKSGRKLSLQESYLQDNDGTGIYPIDDSGIVQFAQKVASPDSRAQQDHYDKVAESYLTNLNYPHTSEYLTYMDGRFRDFVGNQCSGNVLELCCGNSEAGKFFEADFDHLIGVDISYEMVKSARKRFPAENYSFHQADATQLPIADTTIDTVIVFGGIHHINNRENLYSEIARVLKPGGYLVFREPADDFFLWRWIRFVVYRFAPALDHETEAPLRRKQTELVMASCGFGDINWKTFGFIGFCLFMNSDVLFFNRFFQYIPFIRQITRFFAAMDQFLANTRLLRNCGTIVFAACRKLPRSNKNAASLPTDTGAC